MKKYISTRLGPLAVELVGSGPAMMMWPGLFVDSSSFRHQRNYFARSHAVITVDGPGHGANLDVPATFRLLDCAGAAADILAATGSPHALFVGSSWGAIVGLHLATARPELVSRLVLADALLHAPTPGERLRADLCITGFALFGGMRSYRERLIARLYAAEFLQADPRAKANALSEFELMDHRNMVPALRATLRDREDGLAMAAGLDIPLLLIRGEADTIVTAEMFASYAGAVPNARSVILPAAGHMSAFENPAAFNAAVEQFLVIT